MPIYAQSSTLRNLLVPLVDIDQTTLAQDQVIQYNSTTGKFENQSLSLAGAGFLTGAENLGTGEEVHKQTDNYVLQFRSITAGSGITLTTGTDDITIATSGANTSATNIGTGTGIFTSKSGDNIQLRSLKTGTGNINLTVAASGTGNEIEVVNTAEINTASNVGSGTGVFAQKSTYDLQFKSLIAGSNVSLSSDSTSVTITSGSAPNTAFSYQFTINFDAGGAVSTVTDLPSGWSVVVAGSLVTVTHTAGSMIKNLSYWGSDAANGWQLRFPTSGYQATVPAGSETTVFKITVNANVAGADANGNAKVNVIF
tara:strand:- start:2221 stop:3156 length:936 start_codon:yes stop_codon:yes gene_type:complete